MQEKESIVFFCFFFEGRIFPHHTPMKYSYSLEYTREELDPVFSFLFGHRRNGV